MSRVVSPQPSPVSTGGPSTVSQDKIAQRAYEKWCKRGCKHGNDKQDWLDAESELRAEISRNTGSTPPRR